VRNHKRHDQVLKIVGTPQDVGEAAAVLIHDAILEAHSANRNCIIGCPGGRSPRTTYQALAALIEVHATPLNHVVIAMMDEYVDPESGPLVLRNADPSLHYSCRGFAVNEILGPLNAAAPLGQGIELFNLWMPDASDPLQYEAKLRESGVDVFILATGASDGHVAFNGPGSSREAQTRVVNLGNLTRLDNLGTFPEFRSIEEVPLQGVSVGPETIAAVSKSVVLVVHGGHKAEALHRIMSADAYDPTWPSTIVWECQNPRIFADESASGSLKDEPVQHR
jgi:glucosamine-6-phosphate deaminase